MSVLDSLPDRPLSDAELARLNRADALDLAVEVSPEGADADAGIGGLLLATGDWVKGLACGADGWEVVETVPIADAGDRFDAMRDCEDAVRAARRE